MIIPNPEIQAIVNDESPVRVVEGVGPIAGSREEVTKSVSVSSMDESLQD